MRQRSSMSPGQPRAHNRRARPRGLDQTSQEPHRRAFVRRASALRQWRRTPVLERCSCDKQVPTVMR